MEPFLYFTERLLSSKHITNTPPPHLNQLSSPSPKSQIQSPEERDCDWVWHYNPTGHHPPTSSPHITFQCQSSAGKRPSMTFLYFLWLPMTFNILPWPSMHDLLSPSKASQTKAQINSHWISWLDPINSKSSFCFPARRAFLFFLKHSGYFFCNLETRNMQEIYGTDRMWNGICNNWRTCRLFSEL